MINRFKNHLIMAVVLTVLAAAGTMMNSHQASADPPGAPVNIVSSIPLQVTGSTTVSGTVAATQSGLWNVGITGNTAMNPLQVRDVDNPGRHPFTLEVQTVLGSFTNFSSGTAANTSGKRFVVEFLTVAGTMTSGDALESAECGNLTAAPPTRVFLKPVLMRPDPSLTPGSTDYAASQSVKLYIETGDSLSCLFTHTGSVSGTGGSSSVHAVAVGHLVETTP
jgi:hypothetical protein